MLKIALQVLVLAPVFTFAVIVAIFCGVIFDLARHRANPCPDRPDG